jgi:hypothetical protein
VANHRKPVIPFPRAPKGTCKWCGRPILTRGKRNVRANWHPDCVEIYRLAFPEIGRQMVFERDGGICQACGVKSSTWELDHRQPLIDGGSHDPGNLQTLCQPCHRAKTSHEATERARRRREE